MGPVAVITQLGLLSDCALMVRPLPGLCCGCPWPVFSKDTAGSGCSLCYSEVFPNLFQAVIIVAYSVRVQIGVLILHSCCEICLQTVF